MLTKGERVVARSEDRLPALARKLGRAVTARDSIEDVVAILTIEDVVATAAIDSPGVYPAVDDIIPAAPIQRIGTPTTEYGISILAGN